VRGWCGLLWETKGLSAKSIEWGYASVCDWVKVFSPSALHSECLAHNVAVVFIHSFVITQLLGIAYHAHILVASMSL
jgi:hypothetical protein